LPVLYNPLADCTGIILFPRPHTELFPLTNQLKRTPPWEDRHAVLGIKLTRSFFYREPFSIAERTSCLLVGFRPTVRLPAGGSAPPLSTLYATMRGSLARPPPGLFFSRTRRVLPPVLRRSPDTLSRTSVSVTDRTFFADSFNAPARFSLDPPEQHRFFARNHGAPSPANRSLPPRLDRRPFFSSEHLSPIIFTAFAFPLCIS